VVVEQPPEVGFEDSKPEGLKPAAGEENDAWFAVGDGARETAYFVYYMDERGYDDQSKPIETEAEARELALDLVRAGFKDIAIQKETRPIAKVAS
jgi:hypothetical protein